MRYEDIKKKYGPRQVDIAAALNVSQGTVSDWSRDGIPWVTQCKIEVLSGGKLKADKPPMKEAA